MNRVKRINMMVGVAITTALLITGCSSSEADVTVEKEIIRPVKLLTIPSVPEDADDEKKDEINEQIEDFKKKNDEIEKQNAKIDRMKKKVCIKYLPDGTGYEEEGEKALLKLNNHRDAAAEAAILSARTGGGTDGATEEVIEDTFQFEKIPVKINIIPIKKPQIQDNPSGIFSLNNLPTINEPIAMPIDVVKNK